MQPPGPPPAFAPTNGDFTFVSSADADGEREPLRGGCPPGVLGCWGNGGRAGTPALGPAGLPSVPGAGATVFGKLE